MKIKLIDYGYTNAPKRAHYNDCGADVYANICTTIEAHSTCKIPLGFGIELPDGFAGFIFPRSGLASKGIVCEIPPIDSGYTGEIHAIVNNHSDEAIPICENDRIGQLVILPCIICDYVVETGEKREDGAFGSTGK